MSKNSLFSALLCCIILSGFHAKAQDGVLIDYVGTTRDASAVLDVRSTSQGVLVPRVSIANLAAAAPVTTPATGLLVYNTNVATGVGYHYWTGALWSKLRNGPTVPWADITGAPTSYAPSGAAGGDLSGTYPNPQVVDDSHNHTEIEAKPIYSWTASTAPRDFPQAIAASFVQAANGWPSYGSVMHMGTYPDDGGSLQLYAPYNSTYGGNSLRYRLGLYNNAGWTAWKTIWDDTNDGAGSGMDADLLDGQNSSYYAAAANIAGTTNYVAKFASASTIGNSQIYDNGTNVGIGTAGAGARLHVAGGGQIIGTNGTTSATRTLTLLEDGDAQINFGAYPGAWTSALQIQNNDNSDYIWMSPLQDGNNARILTSGSGLDFHVGANAFAATITEAGDIGIGTTTPFDKVNINGRLRFGTNAVSYQNAGAGATFGTGDPTSGIGWGNQSLDEYGIFVAPQENVYGDYTRLIIGWHTGLKIGASSGYGGTRFYNNSPVYGGASATEIMSVGKGDNHVRVENNLYVGAYGGHNSSPTSYGSLGLLQAKGGYYGLLFGQASSNPNIMYDGAGNGGIYYENLGRWSTYYLIGSNHMQINTSSDLGATLGVAGTINATGNIVNTSPTNGTLGLTGDLPGYSAGVYPTLRTNGTYIYFSTSGAYSGWWQNTGISARRFDDFDNGAFYVDPASTTNVNTMISYSYQGNGNVGGTGSASWHPSGVYSAGTNWLYGTSYMHTTYGYIWYDWDNTAFYLNPNDVSNSARFAGRVWTGNTNVAYDYSQNGMFLGASGFAFSQPGVIIESNYGESGGFQGNGNNANIWSPGDDQLLKVFDEDGMGLFAYVNTGGGWVAASDRNKKQNIVRVTGALSKILAISGYTYEFKKNAEELAKGDKPVLTAGVIAQEIQDLMPGVVEDQGKDGLFVNYSALTPYIIEAIKEQQQNLDQVKQTISDFGNEALDNMEAWVAFDAEFVAMNISGVTPIVTITPNQVGVTLSVTETTTKGFKVRSDKAQNCTFNWMAMAKVKSR